MSIDQPITVYPKKKDDKNKAVHSIEELDATTAEWKKNHENDGFIGKKVSLNELFGKGYRENRNKENNE